MTDKLRMPANKSGDGPPAGREGERIAKVMARAGLCSRREAEAWIAAGRVAMNGRTLTSPAVVVGPQDRVTVDGEPLPVRERTRLWLHHKPKGVVVAARDPEGRPTLFERLPAGMPRVVAVGRLDVNTEGLILLTNDGGLARVLELPSTGWVRRYRVRAHGSIAQAALDSLREGITIDGVRYGPIVATLDRVQGSNVWLTMDLREGRNREVKAVLGALDLAVSRLIRIAYGPFQLGDLPPGAVIEVKTRVLADQLGPRLARTAKVDFDAPVRRPTGTPKTGLKGRAEIAAPAKKPDAARRARPQQLRQAALERLGTRPPLGGGRGRGRRR